MWAGRIRFTRMRRWHTARESQLRPERCVPGDNSRGQGHTTEGGSMSAGPDELDRSATALLGDGAYTDSQVSYGGGTYWLERSADGAKRLVAVGDDESAFHGFSGTAEPIDGRVRFVADTTPDNAEA